MFNLLLIGVLGASWGSVDFRIYESDDPYIFPLIIDVENLLEDEFTAELYVKTIYGNGSFGESEMHKLIDIPINPELLYLDFPISALERNNDVLVIVEYNDESEEALHTSLTRLSLDSISDDLPNVEKDIGEVDLDEVDDLEYESSFNFSIIIGILIVLVLFAIVGVVAWLALKD
jgi:hypothetical protein